MQNVLDLYHIDTTTAAGRTEVHEILKTQTLDPRVVDYIMGAISDNANLLADMSAKDEENTDCEACRDLEEENVRLEKVIAQLRGVLVAA